MILKRLFEETLAQASYLVGCPAAGEALIIDPNRDIDRYLEVAAADGLKIVAVTETHIHADYLSGARELAARTGAVLYLSDEGDADWKYAFAGEAALLKDGDTIKIGGINLQAMATPGHTPEHLVFVLTEGDASSEPAMVFTGDFIFVGDVGRPDLLEQAAGFSGTMEPAARALYQSLQRFKSLPEHVLLWPGHGAGSACGKSLGGVPVSTLGYEMRSNWALKAASEEGFVREVLSGQPDPPRYFARMKRLNRDGPPTLYIGAPPRLQSAPAGAFVVDIRATAEFAAGHVAGSLHIPPYRSFTTWAGWLLPDDREIVLLAETTQAVAQAAARLRLIGIDHISGWLGPDAIRAPERLVQRSFSDPLPSDTLLLDVRETREWEEGHAPGSLHIPLGALPQRLSELPGNRTLAVFCESGSRSPIAASILQRAGFDAIDMADGYLGYAAHRPSPAPV